MIFVDALEMANQVGIAFEREDNAMHGGQQATEVVEKDHWVHDTVRLTIGMNGIDSIRNKVSYWNRFFCCCLLAVCLDIFDKEKFWKNMFCYNFSYNSFA